MHNYICYSPVRSATNWCCRRIHCSKSYCCSYARATPPPSAFPLPQSKAPRKKRKKKSKIKLKCVEDCRGPCAPPKARSECLVRKKTCDPRCRSKRQRPATTTCALRQPVCYQKPVCKLRNPCALRRQRQVETAYSMEQDKSDAATLTDLKAHAATSMNNLDIFYAIQKCSKDVQQPQYNQRQMMQNCYNCPSMQTRNQYSAGGFRSPQSQPYCPQFQYPNMMQQVYTMQYQNPMAFFPRPMQQVGSGLSGANVIPNPSNLSSPFSFGSPIPSFVQRSRSSRRCQKCGRVLIQNI